MQVALWLKTVKVYLINSFISFSSNELTLLVVTADQWIILVYVFIYLYCWPPPPSLQSTICCSCPKLSMLYLFVFSWWRGGLKIRKSNHWSASQCLCLCLGFHLSLFPHSHNSFSFFTKPLLPLPHSSTIQDGPGWTCLPFTLPPMSCCLTVHLPIPVSHLCLCCSLTLGMACLDSEETENLSGGRSSEAGKKRSPVVWHKLFGFSITECWNPDVWASFIRKKVLPNGHKPIQNVTWWSLPSLFFRSVHTMSQPLC